MKESVTYQAVVTPIFGQRLKVGSLSEEVNHNGKKKPLCRIWTKVVLAVLSGEKTPSRIYRIPKLNINQVNWWGTIDRLKHDRGNHRCWPN